MKKYKVIYREILEYEFEIEAENAEAAERELNWKAAIMEITFDDAKIVNTETMVEEMTD